MRITQPPPVFIRHENKNISDYGVIFGFADGFCTGWRC